MSAKLVTIGDSLSHGMASGSIYNTNLSYSALIAQCLGMNQYRLPDFRGEGGLPLNMENILRLLVRRYGSKLNWGEYTRALLSVTSLLDRVEDYWERGEGSQPSDTGPLHHHLPVFGFRLEDCDTITEGFCRRFIPEAKDNFLVGQTPEFAMYRASRRVLNPSFNRKYQNLTQLGAAKAIAQREGGIENLIFWLGANNCLATVIDLEIRWSDESLLQKQVNTTRKSNLARPEHFHQLLKRIAPQIDEINAKNVFIGTVPHVTIPPISRGVSPGLTGDNALSEDGYFEFYTQFWVWDSEFSKNPDQYSFLTREKARLIDATIDEYNRSIKTMAKRYCWHVVDMTTILDQLAFRRRQGVAGYQFPQELATALEKNRATQDRVIDGKPLIDTRYLHLNPNNRDPSQRYEGGMFSLDGFHPTTVGYGVVAHEFLKVMQPHTNIVHPLDWNQIVAADTLLLSPPGNLEHLQDTLGFLYHRTPLPKIIEAMSGK